MSTKKYQPICSKGKNPYNSTCCDPDVYYCPTEDDPYGGLPFIEREIFTISLIMALLGFMIIAIIMITFAILMKSK